MFFLQTEKIKMPTRIQNENKISFYIVNHLFLSNKWKMENITKMENQYPKQEITTLWIENI